MDATSPPATEKSQILLTEMEAGSTHKRNNTISARDLQWERNELTARTLVSS